MILSAVSTIDLLVAGLIAGPVLLLNAGLLATLTLIYRALPLILFRVPYHFIARYLKPQTSLPAFSRECSAFEDVMVRIIRYGFTRFPITTLRAFLSKEFAYPFLRWRMFRNGYFKFPAQLHEKVLQEGTTSTKGLWIRQDSNAEPDVVIYYVHGGGFALGSCYFYLEFLLAMHHLLLKAGYSNPAIFALEYTLVPDAVYPTQVNQALLGYRHVLREVKDASKVCVAGDSAGGTLTLSLLLELGRKGQGNQRNGTTVLAVPRMAVLISPWITLKSKIHFPSTIDYLERDMLWQFGEAYAGSAMVNTAAASPGLCDSSDLWKAVSPERGYFIIFGEEETLATDAEAFIRHQRRNRIEVDAMEFRGGIHAWPVASLMLSSPRDRRLQGLESIVGQIRKKFSKEPAVLESKTTQYALSD